MNPQDAICERDLYPAGAWDREPEIESDDYEENEDEDEAQSA